MRSFATTLLGISSKHAAFLQAAQLAHSFQNCPSPHHSAPQRGRIQGTAGAYGTDRHAQIKISIGQHAQVAAMHRTHNAQHALGQAGQQWCSRARAMQLRPTAG